MEAVPLGSDGADDRKMDSGGVGARGGGLRSIGGDGSAGKKQERGSPARGTDRLPVGFRSLWPEYSTGVLGWKVVAALGRSAGAMAGTKEKLGSNGGNQASGGRGGGFGDDGERGGGGSGGGCEWPRRKGPVARCCDELLVNREWRLIQLFYGGVDGGTV